MKHLPLRNLNRSLEDLDDLPEVLSLVTKTIKSRNKSKNKNKKMITIMMV